MAKEMNKNLFFILSLFLVMLTAPVIVRAPAIDHVFAQQQTPIPTPTQDQKLKQMDILMGEHALTGGLLMMSRYDKKPDYSAAKAAVDTNTQLLASQIDDAYGTDAKSKFLGIWNNHINALLTYVDGRRANDNGKMNNALKSLQQFTTDISTFISQNQKEVAFNDAQSYFAQHVLDEKAIIDSYADKNYTRMYSSMHDAYSHATSISAMLKISQ